MKQEQAMNALNHIDPALIEAADLPERRQKSRWVRMALTAACICVALLGAAYAVELATGIQISFFTRLREDKTVSVSRVDMDVEYIPLDQFSEEAKSYFASYQDEYIPCKYFSSWSDAEAFLGIEVQDNPVLDRCSALKSHHIVDGAEYVEHCVAGFYNLPGEGLLGIRLYADYLWSGADASGVIRGINLQLGSKVQIQETTWGNEAAFEDGYYNLVDMDIAETYTTPSGLEAVIVRTYQEFPLKDYVHCKCTYTAYFTLNRASFMLSATTTGVDQPEYGLQPAPDLALTALKEVLDGFS